MASDTNTADPIGSILVPTDGSAAADSALARALQLAERIEATVHILTVVDPANPLQFDVDDVVELDRAANRIVEETVEAATGREVDVQGAVRRGGPAETILDYAVENEIDMLVIGRTERGGVVETLLGSTADQLVRNASVPVVVVPGSDGDGPGPSEDSR